MKFCAAKKSTLQSKSPQGAFLDIMLLFLLLNYRMLHEGFRLLQHLFFGGSTDVPAVDIDKRPFPAWPAIGDAPGLDLGIGCHLEQLGQDAFHFDMIAFVANTYIVSHGATLLYVLEFGAGP